MEFVMKKSFVSVDNDRIAIMLKMNLKHTGEYQIFLRSACYTLFILT